MSPNRTSPNKEAQMPIFDWEPEFSVNIKIIDEQHKKLVETINMLHDAMKEGKGDDVLADIFNRLAEYTTTHFATEEHFMLAFSYPDYTIHKREHDFCFAKVSEFKRSFDKKEIGLSTELITFLIDWLHEHLLHMDKKYSKFFNENGLS